MAKLSEAQIEQLALRMILQVLERGMTDQRTKDELDYATDDEQEYQATWQTMERIKREMQGKLRFTAD